MENNLKDIIQAASSYMQPSKVDCIVYHSPCADGSGAALSAWLVLGNNALYLKKNHQISVQFDLSLLQNKTVVFLDCSLTRYELQFTRSIACKVMVLDHHLSGLTELTDEEGCFFNVDHSGAVSAWHYFHGIDKTPLRILQLIEDRDILRWREREASEALSLALTHLHPHAEFMDYAQYLDSNKLHELIKHGYQLKSEMMERIYELANTAEQKIAKKDIFGKSYVIMYVAMPSYDLTLEVAEYLYGKFNIDFVLLWHCLPDNRYRINLRTNKDDINLSILANTIGGGGHAKKAGAVINMHPIELLE